MVAPEATFTNPVQQGHIELIGDGFVPQLPEDDFSDFEDPDFSTAEAAISYLENTTVEPYPGADDKTAVELFGDYYNTLKADKETFKDIAGRAQALINGAGQKDPTSVKTDLIGAKRFRQKAHTMKQSAAFPLVDSAASMLVETVSSRDNADGSWKITNFSFRLAKAGDHQRNTETDAWFGSQYKNSLAPKAKAMAEKPHDAASVHSLADSIEVSNAKLKDDMTVHMGKLSLEVERRETHLVTVASRVAELLARDPKTELPPELTSELAMPGMSRAAYEKADDEVRGGLADMRGVDREAAIAALLPRYEHAQLHRNNLAQRRRTYLRALNLAENIASGKIHDRQSYEEVQLGYDAEHQAGVSLVKWSVAEQPAESQQLRHAS